MNSSASTVPSPSWSNSAMSAPSSPAVTVMLRLRQRVCLKVAGSMAPPSTKAFMACGFFRRSKCLATRATLASALARSFSVKSFFTATCSSSVRLRAFSASIFLRSSMCLACTRSSCSFCFRLSSRPSRKNSLRNSPQSTVPSPSLSNQVIMAPSSSGVRYMPKFRRICSLNSEGPKLAPSKPRSTPDLCGSKFMASSPILLFT
mmetsp:Transcript_30552/g.49739  ORF Transcript_30552/g.49739 Transcript_30552/m.49739 type:complete len:204 (+) Transcript_30552:687-1298(+)